MENNVFENWEEKKQRILKEHKNLTQDDLIYEIGKEELLLENLQKKLNKTKEEIYKWLSFLG